MGRQWMRWKLIGIIGITSGFGAPVAAARDVSALVPGNCEHILSCGFVLFAQSEVLNQAPPDCPDIIDRYQRVQPLWRSLERAWRDFKDLSERNPNAEQLQSMSLYIHELSAKVTEILPSEWFQEAIELRTSFNLVRHLEDHGKLNGAPLNNQERRMTGAAFGPIQSLWLGGKVVKSSNLPPNISVTRLLDGTLQIVQRLSPVGLCLGWQQPQLTIQAIAIFQSNPSFPTAMVWSEKSTGYLAATFPGAKSPTH